MYRRTLLGLAGLVAAALLPARADDKAPAKTFLDLPLLFSDDFESGKADRWLPTDANAWKVIKQDGNHVLNQFQQSKVKTLVRSPFNRALVKDVIVSDFVLEARVQSTVKDYNHRDLCLFFGYQDDAHLYYVHLGKKADPHANSIFLVDGKDRVSIAKKRADGTDWDDKWHTVRVVRKVETGDITVYFDNMKEPVMTAEDKTFTWGQVGVGSFDDTGNFDDVRLWGKKAERGKK
jgi:hypothetical protein